MSIKNKVFAGLVAATAVAGIGVTTMGAASAATVHPHALPKISVGSIEMGTPLQYASFVTSTGHNHGYIDYTNWQQPNRGTGVWAPETATAHALTFTYAGGTYAHTLNAGLVLTAKSNTRLAFTGSGEYNGGGYPWTIKGQVKGDHVTFTLKTTPASILPGYVMHATGTIAADGSVSGTSSDSLSRTQPWTMPAGSFGEVMQFTTPVTSDTVNVFTRTDTFGWTVPASAPAGIAGLKVVSVVHEGATQAGDTYSHGVPPGAQQNYPVLAGKVFIP